MSQIKEHGKLKFVEGADFVAAGFSLRRMDIDTLLQYGHRLKPAATTAIPIIVFFCLGIWNANFFGKTYLGESLFNSVIAGLFLPYLVLIWPAVIISMLLGMYAGIQTGYVKTGWLDKASSFIWDKVNELIDSIPRFILIFLAIFFISADSQYYQLILLMIIGLLFMPVVYIHFKKRVEWLAGQHFIDAERMVGEKTWRIKLVQILWRNCRMLAISQFFYLYANIILTDACLGYLGVRQLRFPSLGGLLAAEIGFYEVSFWPVFIPAAAISLLIILLNLAGNYFKSTM